MRQRIRAVRAASNSPPVQIGVQLTRSGRSAALAASAPAGPVSGPELLSITTYWAGGPCSWLVWMRGVPAGTPVAWAMTWDGMDAEFAGAVSFSDAIPADESLQVITTTSGGVDNIVIYATVDETVYASEPFACAV